MSDGINCIMAIVAICAICLCSIVHGINSQVVALSIVAIAGLGGYEVYKRTKQDTPVK